jgi:hypothetical protein
VTNLVIARTFLRDVQDDVHFFALIGTALL